MQQLRELPVLILGLGASGLAMARWCARHGAVVTVADTREAPPQLATLQAEWPKVKFIAGAFTAALVEGTPIRAVFRSPGLAPEVVAPVVDAARAVGLWQGGELTLFAQALADLRAEHGYAPALLAITGTNGKTTVTSLTGQLVARAGKSVQVAGNIGPTLLDTLAAALDAAEVQAVEPEPEIEEPTAVTEASEDAEAQDAEATVGGDVAEKEAEKEVDEEVLPEAEPDDEAAPVPATRLLGMPEVWVLELSSFQLDSSEGFEPTAATVLNVTQDHLDWHGSMKAYADAKARIFGRKGLMVLNREDSTVMAMLPEPVKVKLQKPVLRSHVTFGSDMPQRPGDYGLETVNGMTWLVRALEADETRKRRTRAPHARKLAAPEGGAPILGRPGNGWGEEEELHFQRLMPADALRIRGRHNAINALAALALAHSAGCALAPMLFGLREYRGEPHRVEPVAIIDDIEYFDDSKGTNVGATVAALQGLGAERRVVVILGGDGKGQDFSPLAEPVSRHVRAVALIGRDAPAIREALQHCGVPLQDCASLPEAVQRCAELAQPGDAVLLSPACASLDMFDHYAHRAEVFRAAVAELADAAGVSREGGL